jgi:hypothetical protein
MFFLLFGTKGKIKNETKEWKEKSRLVELM